MRRMYGVRWCNDELMPINVSSIHRLLYDHGNYEVIVSSFINGGETREIFHYLPKGVCVKFDDDCVEFIAGTKKAIRAAVTSLGKIIKKKRMELEEI